MEERMNTTIQQMARVTLDELGTPHTFSGKATHTIMDISNKPHVWVNNDKSSHELWFDVVIDEAYIGTKKEEPIDDEPLPTTSQKVVGEGNKEAPEEGNQNTDSFEKTPSRYLQQQGFIKGFSDRNLYIKFDTGKLLIVFVYVDDIIFGSNVESMSQEFASVMKQEFEMSLLGELTNFLGIQVQRTKNGIFISQTKYLKHILKKYGMEGCKYVCTTIVIGCNIIQNDDSPFVNQP